MSRTLSVETARPFHVHVEREVAGAEGSALHARRNTQDLAQVRDARAGLDDRDEVDAPGREPALALELRHQPIGGGDVTR